jgi:hypothetical protein
MTQNRTLINLITNPTNLTSKINNITSKSFKVKSSNKMKTMTDPKNSNKIGQEKNLVQKTQSRRKNYPEP